MVGTDSGAGPSGDRGWRWDVALSFAGAQRAYVGQVAAMLKAQGVRCFYDEDEQVRVWGTYLAEELPQIYAQESAAVVVFISADYAGRDWTRLERRAAFSRAVAEAGVFVLPARFDDSELPGLLPDMVTADLRRYTPAQFADLVAAKLAALGVTALAGSPARAAIARPPGSVRVADADLRRLGVHAAISTTGVPDEIPPEYVPRDTDAGGHGVRAKLAAATERGGFVLLVGGSSVGKTRCAAEAVKGLLADWWLVHPAGPGEVAALAAAPPARTVVWLDELQRYLDGEHGLTGGVVRALLNAADPVVVIGTLWPDRYLTYIAVPVPGGPDPNQRERAVLDLADVIRIAPQFTAGELGRARAAAARDARLQDALGAAGYGLTQTLAAAPQLVACWEDAQTTDPYAWAVLTAALDTARLGARTPLKADFLRAAAPDYCTSQQQAEAPENWFEQALAYATRKVHGAAAALSPAAAGMSQVAGYTPADYLIQHASRKRRYARLPAGTWDAILTWVHDPSDAFRLAEGARNRLLYCYAIPLYRHAADVGDENAAWGLADLLEKRGDLDGAAQVLRGAADGGDGDAAERLADLLKGRGDLDELRARADGGDGHAAERLADLLKERGDLDELRARADGGDGHAAERLADLLKERGDLDGTAQVLRGLADAGEEGAARRLAGLLKERGDLDGAVQVLRKAADASGGWDAVNLAALLKERGDLDGLRGRADADDRWAATFLAELLKERGELDELRARADADDDGWATVCLGRLLEERGDLDGAARVLRARAEGGDWRAARWLADLLEERGDSDGAAQVLRGLADAGDEDAARRLADLLKERGDLDGLRLRADAGDGWAAGRLAGLLGERGDLDGAARVLRARADAGDGRAAERLAYLLGERGDLDGLRLRADADDGHAARRLAELLAQRGDLDGLRASADAGVPIAARCLAALLTQRGRGEEAERLRRFGLNPDASVAQG